MTTTSFTLTVLACAGSLGTSTALGLGLEYQNKIQGANLGGGNGEIVAYSPFGSTLATTGDTGLQLFSLGANYGFSTGGFLDYSTAFTAESTTLLGVSSVALDRQGRGFGVATLIPTANTSVPGKLAFFDHLSGSPVVTVDVGFHPDSVSLSADGRKVFVVNEGEFKTAGDANQAPGSVTVLDISAVTDFTDPVNITANLNQQTYDFSAANLASAGLLDGIRQNDPTASVVNNLEPEYASLDAATGKLYVSLQENNAVAALDLNSGKWEAVNQLGPIIQTLDASDQDGPGNTPKLEINDPIAGLPMPDTVATFTVGGRTYLATANEGDARPDDADQQRVRSLGSGGKIGASTIDSATAAALDAQYGGNFRARGALGQLNLSTIDGDTDGDGDIDVLTAFGTRSFSIYEVNPATGQLLDGDGDAANGLSPLWDSGALEAFFAALEPLSDLGNGQGLHNSEGTLGSFDGRSDNKGPEPEALTYARIAGRDLLAVAAERQGGLLLYDVSDPHAPLFLAYLNSSLDQLLVAPESILMLSGVESPTGKPMMIVGYEANNGGIGLYEIPEPSTCGIAFALAGLLFAASRRLRRHRNHPSER